MSDTAQNLDPWEMPYTQEPTRETSNEASPAVDPWEADFSGGKVSSPQVKDSLGPSEPTADDLKANEWAKMSPTEKLGKLLTLQAGKYIPTTVPKDSRTIEPGMDSLGYLGGVTSTGLIQALKGLAGKGSLSDIKAALRGEAKSAPQQLQESGWSPLTSYAAGIPLQMVTDPFLTAIGPLKIPGGNKLSQFADTVAKNSGYGLLNIPKEATTDYLANAEKINAQRPFDDIHDDVLNIINGKRSAVDLAKEQFADRQNEFNQLQQDTRQNIASDRMDSQGDLQTANSNLDDSYSRAIEALQNRAKPIELKDSAVNAVGTLRQKAIEAEDEASKILSDQNVTLPVDQLISKIRQIKSNYGIGPNKNIFTGANKEAANELDQIRADLKRFQGVPDEQQEILSKLPEDIGDSAASELAKNKELSAEDSRTLLKSLNNRINFLDTSGGFMGSGSNALNGLRGYVRQKLGELSPEFDAAMKEKVAPKFNLLSDADQYFGNDQKALSNLNGITNPINQYKREILEKLGIETGADFAGPIQAHAQTQAILNSPEALRALKNSLPESSDQLNAMAQYQTLKRPAMQKSFLENAVGNSSQAEALAQAREGLVQAQEKLDPYKTLANGTAQNFLKSAQNGNSINNISMLKQLGSETGNDFLQELKNLKTRKAFSNDATRGSRLTALGGLLGAAAAHSLGLPYAGGVALGGSAGAAADRFGGAAFKGLLDAKMGTDAALRRANIPIWPQALTTQNSQGAN